MKKIVIIDHEPLSIRRKQIFYIDSLLEKGFDIEFWDCSALFYPGMVIVDTIDEPYKVQIDSMVALEHRLERADVENAVFVVEAFDIWRNRHFFKLLSDKKCFKIRMELFANSVLPDISLAKKLFLSSPSKVIDAIKNKLSGVALRVYKKINNVKGYDVLICSGNNPAIDVHINHPDWEVFMNTTPCRRRHDFAVFLDEYFPLHPDLEFFVKDFKADSDKYQAAMRSFFEEYHRQSGNDVVIAAHPKSAYSGAPYGNFELVKYNTAALVKGSQSVFMHTSSALSFAVIADKPIALLFTDDYERTFALYTHLQRVSRLLKLPIYNVDKQSANEVVPMRVSKVVREQYIYSYLTTPDTEKLSNVEILSRFFAGLS